MVSRNARAPEEPRHEPVPRSAVAARIGLDRIDNVPWRWRPVVWLWWGFWAVWIEFWNWLLHHTCRREIHGAEHLASRANFIYCGWHDTIVPYAVAYRRFDRKMVQLTNDAWFMWPVHVFVRRMGMEHLVSLGPGGSSTEALAQIIRHLQDGYSTVITPDGPAGPPRTLRRGCLLLAMKSGVPILPLRTEARHAWVWGWTWDKKRVPLPFSKVVVRYGAPIYVTADTLAEAQAELMDAMGL